MGSRPTSEEHRSAIAPPFTVRGTEIRPDDTPAQRRHKLACISVDELLQLVGVLDLDGTLLECNEAPLAAGGVTREEVIGRPFWETFWWTVSPNAQAQLRDAIARAARGELVRYDAEVRGRSGGRDTMVVDFTLRPVRDDDGRVVLLLSEGRDITEKKAHEREIDRQREAAMRARDEFLTIASHELRTPLTTLGLQIDGLLRAMQGAGEQGPAPERWLAKVHRIRAEADRLETLVEELLDSSEVAGQLARPRLEDVELRALVRAVAERLGPDAKKARSTIEVAGDEVVGRWDRRRLEHVVGRLVSNALKFGAGQTVSITVEAAVGLARLCVVDRGIGIAAQDQERIFGRFERATPSTHYGGFGLGLWSVRQAVTAMGGTVRVKSEPGRGAAFIVELPLEPTS